jgi:hypothetical protein
MPGGANVVHVKIQEKRQAIEKQLLAALVL